MLQGVGWKGGGVRVGKVREGGGEEELRVGTEVLCVGVRARELACNYMYGSVYYGVCT
jgi:hypothetical protein